MSHTGTLWPRRHRYDAIVVGARCAGAATAMLLARRGFDVLLVDRARSARLSATENCPW
jgi:glycine/D-amino acid oxidase-like deaminating enzyme